MLRIESDSVILTLNKKFYSKESIKQTINDFKEVCETELSEKEYFKIVLKPKEECNLREFGLEFANYCLGVMK